MYGLYRTPLERPFLQGGASVSGENLASRKPCSPWSQRDIHVLTARIRPSKPVAKILADRAHGRLKRVFHWWRARSPVYELRPARASCRARNSCVRGAGARLLRADRTTQEAPRAWCRSRKLGCGQTPASAVGQRGMSAIASCMLLTLAAAGSSAQERPLGAVQCSPIERRAR
jgi:hypothetical protein